jgi:multiple antibiotic resistance protein
MENFWLCFVPLFVAVDALGILPVYMGLTQELRIAQKKKLIIQSFITASAVAVVFLAAGPWILRFVGITIPDFMVAGGVLLFAISLSDLLTGEKRQRMVDPETLGAVPIGVPLITGPAVLTTSMLLADSYGMVTTGIAVVLNVGLACLVFMLDQPISNFLGNSGAKILSKVASLFMASIAVMLVRRGVIGIVETLSK